MTDDPDFQVQPRPPAFGGELLPPSSDCSCNGCSYPHPTPSKGNFKWTTRRTNLSTIASRAEGGCLTCSLFREGIERIMADNESLKAEHIIIQVINSRMKAVLVHIFGTPGVISFYVSES